MIERKPKKCKGINRARSFKGCGTLTLERTHGLCYKCLRDWHLNTEEGQEKVRKASLKASKDVKQEKDRAWKKEKAKMKDSLETVSEAKQKLQPIINKISRLIDKDVPCMMCGSTTFRRKNGCHYHSVKANDTLRFNLHNIAIGCHKCNGEEGGNITGYDNRLIEVYGKDHWEYVKFDIVRLYPYLGLTKPDIHKTRLEALKIVKELEKSNFTYPPRMRLKMRTEINSRLNIYK